MSGLNYGKSFKNGKQNQNFRKPGFRKIEKTNKWIVFGQCKKIKSNTVNLGRFDTEEEAEKCYNDYLKSS